MDHSAPKEYSNKKSTSKMEKIRDIILGEKIAFLQSRVDQMQAELEKVQQRVLDQEKSLKSMRTRHRKLGKSLREMQEICQRKVDLHDVGKLLITMGIQLTNVTHPDEE